MNENCRILFGNHFEQNLTDFFKIKNSNADRNSLLHHNKNVFFFIPLTKMCRIIFYCVLLFYKSLNRSNRPRLFLFNENTRFHRASSENFM